MTHREAPAPGWYQDPLDPDGLRWWNGNGWTDHRLSADEQPRDPAPPEATNSTDADPAPIEIDELWQEFNSTVADTPTMREPSAEERYRHADRQRRSTNLARRLAAADELRAAQVRRNRRRRTRRATVGAAMLVVVAVGIGVAATRIPSSSPRTGVPERGIPLDHHTDLSLNPSDDRPTPQPLSNEQPLGHPPPLPIGNGKYDFMQMQQVQDAPVAYDPCRPIRYVVNSEDAPPEAERLLREALRRLEQATGLVFEDGGNTNEPPTEKRRPFQPDRYGDTWAPVVVWWTTPAKFHDLQGGVAGLSGSMSIETSSATQRGLRVNVTGMLALDGPQLAKLLAVGPNGAAHVRAVILHELGHLVGLGHVNDPSQIMYPEGGRVTDYGDGDLRGLHELGTGECALTI